MALKIEFDFKDAILIGNAACAKSAGSDVEGSVPGMVLPGHGTQADFAYNLGPLMDGLEGFVPVLVVQFGPGRGATVDDGSHKDRIGV